MLCTLWKKNLYEKINGQNEDPRGCDVLFPNIGNEGAFHRVTSAKNKTGFINFYYSSIIKLLL